MFVAEGPIARSQGSLCVDAQVTECSTIPSVKQCPLAAIETQNVDQLPRKPRWPKIVDPILSPMRKEHREHCPTVGGGIVKTVPLIGKPVANDLTDGLLFLLLGCSWRLRGYVFDGLQEATNSPKRNRHGKDIVDVVGWIIDVQS